MGDSILNFHFRENTLKKGINQDQTPKMMSAQDVRYSFVVDWYDAQASLIRQYQFLFYPKDNSIEMYDVKNKKKFFTRQRMDSISIKQLFLHNRINVCSRQLDIVDYGDEYTRKALTQCQERTLALIKPDAIQSSGEIIEVLERNTSLRICDCRMVNMTRNNAVEFYQEHQGKPFFEGLINHMTSGPVFALELIGENAVSQWRNLLGATNPLEAKSNDPRSIRAMFGSCLPKNACHGSDGIESAFREVDFFFGKGKHSLNTTATCSETSSCVIVKPHCVLNGQFGSVLAKIQASGWDVKAVKLHNFERANAEEFYEVYKEVVQEYDMMVSELTSGPCIALEVAPMGNSSNESVARFKSEVAGPRDPVIAKDLDPHTLRAMFGQDKVKNCVHCTDLPDDSTLELSYCFQILCE